MAQLVREVWSEPEVMVEADGVPQSAHMGEIEVLGRREMQVQDEVRRESGV